MLSVVMAGAAPVTSTVFCMSPISRTGLTTVFCPTRRSNVPDKQRTAPTILVLIAGKFMVSPCCLGARCQRKLSPELPSRQAKTRTCREPGPGTSGLRLESFEDQSFSFGVFGPPLLPIDLKGRLVRLRQIRIQLQRLLRGLQRPGQVPFSQENPPDDDGNAGVAEIQPLCLAKGGEGVIP